ncbi:GtrA family protein [Salibacteraceae bacterium]|jgi:putative flippase GtrA|nr:GtrA family protein [Salibacteraceae bacterium]MDB9710076.1 GtrA family protein [Salibacteraceae bacterium]MDC1304075.1 GtrA family protein [Salibacteraceae bacterium]HAQ70618.1 hypothetical protein [Flavobacteriales bacterium]
MQKNLESIRTSISPLKKQLIKFTLIGVLAVMVDLTCYYILLNIFPENWTFGFHIEDFAKAISFLCGMSVTYTFNKLWTWKSKNRSNKRVLNFTILYSISLFVNVFSNSMMLDVLHNVELFKILDFKYLIAFITATGISASLNFIGQKFWVFKTA